MRVPLSWLREYVDLPAEVGGRELAARLIALGLEVETVETFGATISGPIVAGAVTAVTELTEFKKPIRFCRVDVGADNGGVRDIVCGASNFEIGDLVVVALPGAVLAGDFKIAARETYGHTSDGMICADRELGLGDDDIGIMVLEPNAHVVGADLIHELGFGDEILDIAVTPDLGHALSIRGVAREASIAFGVAFRDPGVVRVALRGPSSESVPVESRSQDEHACDVFTLRTIVGIDPSRRTPRWMRQRLIACGMRPISLTVDITNYVMLELGQPLHAFDVRKLKGTVTARRARAGELLTTLDHIERELCEADLVIADDSGPIALAGTMGGLTSEIDDQSTDLALEAAHFDPVVVATMARRHKLSSEASRRFERGVDRNLPEYASARATELILSLAGGVTTGVTASSVARQSHPIEMAASLPGAVAGIAIDQHDVQDCLVKAGCTVFDNRAAQDTLVVNVPSWRHDLTDPADLVAEVLRLVGYDTIPSTLPRAVAGNGLTRSQRLARRASRAAAGCGLVEVLSYPFVGPADFDALNLGADDPRRRTVKVVNPLSETQPGMATTLLPGLLAAARRNVSRGADHVAIYEIGCVFDLAAPFDSLHKGSDNRLSTTSRPSEAELAALDALLPDQPRHLAAVLCGQIEQKGWWGPGRRASWADAVGIARRVGVELGITIDVVSGDDAPFHPGRCGALSIDGKLIGYAGEFAPRVVTAWGLGERAVGFELNLDVLIDYAPTAVSPPVVGAMPVAKEDVAVVVDDCVSASEVSQALRVGAGPLLESIRLFDIYTGPQIGSGKKSLAFSLRFRAPDRTLELWEVSQARDAAVAAAAARVGAELRGPA